MEIINAGDFLLRQLDELLRAILARVSLESHHEIAHTISVHPAFLICDGLGCNFRQESGPVKVIAQVCGLLIRVCERSVLEAAVVHKILGIVQMAVSDDIDALVVLKFYRCLVPPPALQAVRYTGSIKNDKPLVPPQVTLLISLVIIFTPVVDVEEFGDTVVHTVLPVFRAVFNVQRLVILPVYLQAKLLLFQVLCESGYLTSVFNGTQVSDHSNHSVSFRNALEDLEVLPCELDSVIGGSLGFFFALGSLLPCFNYFIGTEVEHLIFANKGHLVINRGHHVDDRLPDGTIDFLLD